MLIVNKNNPSVRSEDLSPNVTYYLEKAAKEGGIDECLSHPATVKLLNTLHKKSLWLVCRCLVELDITDSPALAVVKRKDTFFLRNLPSRSGHSPKCYFSYQKQFGLSRNKSIHVIKNPLNLHQKNKVSNSKTGQHRNKGNGAITKLGRLLLHFLNEAGGLEISANHSFKDLLDRIRAVASNYQAWNGMPLNDVLELSAKRITKQALQIKNLRAEGNPSAYGLVIAIFHRIERINDTTLLIRDPNKLQPTPLSIEINRSFELLADTSKVAHGAYLAIFTQAPSKGESFVKPQKGAAIAIASTSCTFPVESDFERRFVLDMISYIDYLAEKQNVFFRIRKNTSKLEKLTDHVWSELSILEKDNEAIIRCLPETLNLTALEQAQNIIYVEPKENRKLEFSQLNVTKGKIRSALKQEQT